ncbi:hypothetical protein ERD78_06540 [Allopusillimonas soli]|uniref:Phosphoglycerate mutase n=1 Tax=Allopusillimonas soli TaxID=659016 RepID=A0A853F969_9BURK|nr:hypothetical protein [Allopusillimonas soli]NYT36527.1 hypothetical protein [Allopusillimonas soli]TEA75027.1 hypothetical protein ERD78_06540 [Allopusillimonas soli]
MRIVLPGALPDPAVAGELAAHLGNSAPTLLQWLSHARCTAHAADTAASGCLPHELWLLQACGFQPEGDQNFATGLGPLHAGKAGHHDDQPIWVAELVHVAPSRDGAALLPARELAITPDQSVALFESVHDRFLEDGFQLEHIDTEHWRLTPPEGFTAASASPALVSVTSVNDWWPQAAQARPWRRLVNEIQMLWFAHPINAARQEQGLPPVNSLWLYGGARPGQLASIPADDTQIHENLLEPLYKQDWGGWITALAALENHVFAPLGTMPSQLILTGRERSVSLTPSRAHRWLGRLPGRKQTWRTWWSSQN